MKKPPHDLVRTTLGVLSIGALIVASLWVLRPFLVSTIWATMIVVATWPELRWFESRMRGRRSLAVLIMTLLLLLLFVLPLLAVFGTLVGHSDDIKNYAGQLKTMTLPSPPAWVANLPLIGDKIASYWNQALADGPNALVIELTPYADNIAKWTVSQAGTIGALMVQFFLTVLLSAMMYASGESVALTVRRFGLRLAGPQGENSVILAGQSIRAVALGVGVTAAVQSGLGGIGLALAGVPFAGLLTAVMVLLCIAQIGPSLVMFPAVAWLYWSGNHSWGTFLLLWSVVVVTMDNFLRPALIKRGADLPLLLIFAGVIGGLLAFGLLGIFVGPVLLAVSYTLMLNWIGDGSPPEQLPSAPLSKPPEPPVPSLQTPNTSAP